MSWARLDDAILDNPKIIAAGPLGFALHVAAITWCARNLSDGLIPKRRVAQLLDLPSLHVSETTKVRVLHTLTPDDLAADMVRVGLWHDRGECWELHDFLVYNFSRAQVVARRARTRKRVNKHRTLDCNAVTNALVTHLPGPGPGPVPLKNPLPIGSGRAREGELFPRAVPSAPPRRKPRCPVPDDFALTDALRDFAEAGGLDPAQELAAMRDHYRANGELRADWPATFREWCRRTLEFRERRARR